MVDWHEPPPRRGEEHLDSTHIFLRRLGLKWWPARQTLPPRAITPTTAHRIAAAFAALVGVIAIFLTPMGWMLALALPPTTVVGWMVLALILAIGPLLTVGWAMGLARETTTIATWATAFAAVLGGLLCLATIGRGSDAEIAAPIGIVLGAFAGTFYKHRLRHPLWSIALLGLFLAAAAAIGFIFVSTSPTSSPVHRR